MSPLVAIGHKLGMICSLKVIREFTAYFFRDLHYMLYFHVYLLHLLPYVRYELLFMEARNRYVSYYIILKFMCNSTNSSGIYQIIWIQPYSGWAKFQPEKIILKVGERGVLMGSLYAEKCSEILSSNCQKNFRTIEYAIFQPSTSKKMEVKSDPPPPRIGLKAHNFRCFYHLNCIINVMALQEL